MIMVSRAMIKPADKNQITHKQRQRYADLTDHNTDTFGTLPSVWHHRQTIGRSYQLKYIKKIHKYNVILY